MKPFDHAKNSVRKFKCGTIEDYLPIHDFMDSSKMCLPDMRHRALLHHSFGIFVAERVFGTTITTSDGKQVCVRDIAEQHVIEDVGYIPTVEDCFEGMPVNDTVGARKRKLLYKGSLDGFTGIKEQDSRVEKTD